MPAPLTKETIPQALLHAQEQIRAGQFAQAQAIFHQILQINPRHAGAMYMLGLIELQANRPEAAATWLGQSAAIEPRNAAAHIDLGTAMLMRRKLDAAIDSYQRAISLQPNNASAICNLGIALSEAGRLDEALNCFERAVVLGPNLPDTHNNLANALKSRGRIGDAINAFRRALELRPDWAGAWNNLANVLKDSGRIDEAVAASRRTLQLEPAYVTAHSNLLLLLHCDHRAGPKEIFDEHVRWNNAHALPLQSKTTPHTSDRSPDRRLRVGYVSADMRDHAVACFFESLLSSHSSAEIETFCYADIPRMDYVSTRLKQRAGQWHGIHGMNDEALDAMIRQHQIDIVVDLSGHTAGNRLLVLARKPAPVQVTYLGYPDTSGMSAIDYRLTDPLADPPGMTEQFHSEQLVRLPQTFLCYRPPDHAPADVSPLPASCSGRVTFGSFNILPKINAPLVELWSAILRRCPGAKMLLKSGGLDDPGTRQRLLDLFVAHQIEPQRLEIRGKIPSQADHMKLYDMVDIALDTFPYHGTTTTCEALWMGVPVVTLAGSTHVSRVGVSILTNVGLPQFVAQNRDDYVRIAADLANNRKSLEELRSTMRRRLRESPLMDPARFARNVERAYRTMWNIYTSGEKPKPISIAEP